jgi:hypothetical protein
MKRKEKKNDPAFRELTSCELYKYKGGLCILPTVLGQKFGRKLFELISSDNT